MKKLSQQHVTALDAFSGPVGAPYGPKSKRPRITRRTAEDLERWGLATLSVWEGLPWGEATDVGRRSLPQIRRLAAK